MVVKKKGMPESTPNTNYQCSGERPSTKRRYTIFALIQWFRGLSIAVFNLFKTIL
jgi:hypothetical protein